MIQVYAKADAAGRVEELGSSVFLTDLTGWVQIDEGEGDRYAHAQGNYLDKPLTEEDGTHNYMLDGSTIREATSEEKGSGESWPSRSRNRAGRNSWKRRWRRCIAGRRAFGGEPNDQHRTGQTAFGWQFSSRRRALPVEQAAQGSRPCFPW